MAATIVNDGAGSRGMLFSGKKFWIAQRVPTRNRWIDLVKANGGEIVLLEEQADIMIADHARKDAPPGTISWRFIEDSVKNGKLEDLEKHPAGPALGTLRQVGAAQPPRRGRRPFTAEDDLLLAGWVASKEAQGISIRGNITYQELEKQHPQHTFQSWRDRWIKYIQYRPQSEIVAAVEPASAPRQLAFSPIWAHDHAARLPKSPKQDIPRPETVEDSPSMPASPAPDASAPITESHRLRDPPINSPKSIQSTAGVQADVGNSMDLGLRQQTPIKGQQFTHEDYELLEEIYDDIINIDEEKVVAAWQAWAHSNPQHTAQEWYDFWEGKVRPEGPFQSKELTKRKVSRSRKRIETASNATPPKNNELHFRRKLAEFSAQHKIVVDFNPKLGERRISLFKLFQVIRKPEVGGFDRIEASGRWPEIASFLGLNTFRDPSIPFELKWVYEYMLADFSDFIKDYWDILNNYIDRGDRLTEEEKTDYEVFAPHSSNLFERTPTPEPDDEGALARASESFSMEQHGSPVPKGIGFNASTKRLLQEVEATSSKQRKIENGKGKGKVLEIPSTPENLLSSNGQAHRPSPPMFSVPRSIHESIRLSGVGEEGRPLTNNSKSNHSSSNTLQPSSKQKPGEPGTHEFHLSYPIPVEEGNSIGDSIAAIAGSIHEDSSTQSQSDSQRAIAELQETIDYYVALRYPEETVRKALAATTMETGDLGIVVESITSGNGIPDNIQGVWTLEDDQAVTLSENSVEHRVAVTKHGEARCDVRKQFLKDAEAIR